MVEVRGRAGPRGVGGAELDEPEAATDDRRVAVAGRAAVDDRVLEVDGGAQGVGGVGFVDEEGTW